MPHYQSICKVAPDMTTTQETPNSTNLDEIPRSNSESIPYFLSAITKYTKKCLSLFMIQVESHFRATQNGIPRGNLSGAKEMAEKLFMPQTAN